MPTESVPHKISSLLKRTLTRLDVHAGRHRHTLAGTRQAILKSGEIGLVIDVGAHAGSLRGCGYRGKIVSFEPVGSQFEQLLAAADGDAAWECRNRAAGAREEIASINVSGNEGFSSSLLEMEEAHRRAVANSGYERTETIAIARLDDELTDLPSPPRRAYLKVDTQGYEHEVLVGAVEVLKTCRAVELELSLAPLYEGQLLIGAMIEQMRSQGFAPTHLEPEFVDPHSGELLQVNGLFQPV